MMMIMNVVVEMDTVVGVNINKEVKEYEMYVLWLS